MYRVTGNLTHDGQVYSEGEFVELSEDQAKPLLEAGVIATEGEEVRQEEETSNTPETPELEDSASLESLSYKELQERAKELGLPAFGTKKEIISRITNMNANEKAAEANDKKVSDMEAKEEKIEDLGDDL